eukprot:GEMP01078340.1.p1 GENE.GEMP01078340.1~~GEMP01078340.1.p1  ORF type:complete len:245 (+),score=26.92 GEMP01078340.1:158-892(+)
MEEEEELRAGEKLLREQCKCDGAGHFFRTRVIHGLQIREIPWDLAGDVGTGGVVWRAADVLISHLPAADEIAGKRVLELGSGCGLPGLVLACRGADVVLSDYAPILVENLKYNSAMNEIPVRCIQLDWHAIEDADQFGPFDLVIGSDLVYGDRGPLLASVISALKFSNVRGSAQVSRAVFCCFWDFLCRATLKIGDKNRVESVSRFCVDILSLKTIYCILHYILLHYTTPHYVALYYIILRYIR